MKKVGVILVNYNGEMYNNECIDSLLNSDYQNLEIIVVDNASTDNSLNVLKNKYKNIIKIIESKENLGFSGANNLGIDLAKEIGCDYILLLNNDTVIKKNSIIEMMRLANKYPNDVIAPKINYFDKKDIIWSAGGGINWAKGNTFHYGMNKYDNGEFDEEKIIEFATGCALLLPLSIIEKVGYLEDEYFLYYEDTDYCTRIIKNGFTIRYCPESVIYHKVSMSTGGGESELYCYYIDRNRLLFNKKYNDKKYIQFLLYFYITRFIKIIKWNLTGKSNLAKSSIRGIKDFYQNKFGKKEFVK